jgi:hypothetical protein
MEGTAPQLIVAVALAVAFCATWIGMDKAAERWKWLRIVGYAVLLLILAVVGIEGARLFFRE